MSLSSGTSCIIPLYLKKDSRRKAEESRKKRKVESLHRARAFTRHVYPLEWMSLLHFLKAS